MSPLFTFLLSHENVIMKLQSHTSMEHLYDGEISIDLMNLSNNMKIRRVFHESEFDFMKREDAVLFYLNEMYEEIK